MQPEINERPYPDKWLREAAGNILIVPVYKNDHRYKQLLPIGWAIQIPRPNPFNGWPALVKKHFVKALTMLFHPHDKDAPQEIFFGGGEIGIQPADPRLGDYIEIEGAWLLWWEGILENSKNEA